MESFHANVFINEVKCQCKFAIYSYEDIKIHLEKYDADRTWYSIQSFLVAVGNISKLLWTKNDNPRGAELRVLLSIDEGSLLKLRDFRNHFEHFDERLERWVLPLNNIIDANIAPSGSIKINGIVEMRSFDPTSYTVSFRGDTYEMLPVIQEVQSLFEAINARKTKRFT